jgi:uncharacterized membrane protein YhaH (DUF805 family)
MTWTQKFFSFEGRLRRQDFWICTIVLCVVMFIVQMILGMVFGASLMASSAIDPNDPAAAAALAGQMGPLFGMLGICFLISLWPSLAIVIKRHHDRNQSGWFTLILLIPLVGFFWWLINLGILDGTPGPNQYGPSPKGLGEAPAAA